MTITVSQVANSQTFGSWLDKFNQIANIISQNTVTVDASSNGSVSSGNGFVNGYFGATHLYTNNISGGNLNSQSALTLSTNLQFINATAGYFVLNSNSTTTSLTVNTALFTLNSANINFGGSTFDINSTNTNISSTLDVSGVSTFTNTVTVTNHANVDTLNISNATGISVVNGNMIVVGTLSAGNIAFTGTSNGSIMPALDNTFALGNSSLRWANVYVQNVFTNNVSASGILSVTGATTLSNTLSVTGAANLSSTLGVVGATTLSNTLSVSGLLTLSNVVVAPVGNVTNPTYTFAGNTDTGIFKTAANGTLGISAGGVAAIVANSTVTVINTTTNANSINVANTLTVTGNSTFNANVNVENVLIVQSNTSGNYITANGITTFSSNATFNSSVVISGNVSISNTLYVNSNIILDSVAQCNVGSYTFANSNTIATFDSWSTTSFRSAEYYVYVKDTSLTPNQFQTTKLLVMHDGTNPYITEFGSLYSNGVMGVFNASIATGNCNITFTPVSNNCVVNFVKTIMLV